MDYVNLGKSGLKISRIGMGGMTLGREVGEAEALRMLELAYNQGINFFDTSNSYAKGKSEELIGKAFEKKRNHVVIATKVFNPMGDGPNERGGSRYHIVRAVEESLRRLRTDRIDLYQLHRFDPDVPLEETIRALDDLVRWGKVVYVGCSNYTAQQLRDALRVSEGKGLHPFISVQPMYNLLKREVESELLPLCMEKGIGVIPYNPLAGGFLTGKYSCGDQPQTGTRLGDTESYRTRYLANENFARVSRFLSAAQKRDVHPIALSIAWVCSHPAVTAPIIGARSEEQLKQTLSLSELKISIEERDQIMREVYEDVSYPSPKGSSNEFSLGSKRGLDGP
jgi:aryl-alcohol dehydrogenase-like predicted oxidoreductase